MPYILVKEYAKLHSITEQAVYQKIKKGQVDSIKDEKGQYLIYIKDQSKLNEPPISETINLQNQLIDTALTERIETIQEFYKGLMDDLKNQFNSALMAVKDSKESEIKVLNDKYNSVMNLKDEIIKSKDDKINEQLEEIKSLREKLKEKKPFFKRLFGE